MDTIELQKRAALDEHGADANSEFNPDLGVHELPQPTLADAVLHVVAEGARLAEHETVGKASKAVVETCEEYDVPVDSTDIVVVGVEGTAAPLSCTAYGAALQQPSPRIEQWRVGEEPEGYVIFVEEDNHMTAHSLEEAVRHEIAHICGWADEGVTYEQTQNHKKWCERLDTW